MSKNGLVSSSSSSFPLFPNSPRPTDEEALALEEHFRDNSYCVGHAPTEWDLRLRDRLVALKEEEEEEELASADLLPCLRRWLRHVGSLGEGEREEIEKGAMDVDSRVRRTVCRSAVHTHTHTPVPGFFPFRCLDRTRIPKSACAP